MLTLPSPVLGRDPAPSKPPDRVCLSLLVGNSAISRSSSPGPMPIPAHPSSVTRPVGIQRCRHFSFMKETAPCVCRLPGSIRQGTFSQAWSQLRKSDIITSPGPAPQTSSPSGEAIGRRLVSLDSSWCLGPDPSVPDDFVSTTTAHIYQELTVCQKLGKTSYKHCFSLCNNLVK